VALFLQDAIVAGVALWAVILVVRRVFTVFHPPPDAPACSNCASCPAPRPPVAPETAIPVTLIRSGQKSAAGSHPGR
jgi:hypothetical protein